MLQAVADARVELAVGVQEVVVGIDEDDGGWRGIHVGEGDETEKYDEGQRVNCEFYHNGIQLIGKSR